MTKTTKMTVKYESYICDDCGRSSWKHLATRFDYSCSAPRTVYICKRCMNGETPITITSDRNIPSMPNHGWERY